MLQGRTHFHHSLRKHRKIMGYTLRDVAYRLNLKSTNRISRWEQGTAFPSVKNLLMLSIVYRTLSDQLYEEYRNELRVVILKREQLLLEKQKTKSNVEK